MSYQYRPINAYVHTDRPYPASESPRIPRATFAYRPRPSRLFTARFALYLAVIAIRLRGEDDTRAATEFLLCHERTGSRGNENGFSPSLTNASLEVAAH